MARLTSAFKNLMSVYWVMADFYLLLLLTGTFMAQLPRDFWTRNPMYDVHNVFRRSDNGSTELADSYLAAAVVE